MSTTRSLKNSKGEKEDERKNQILDTGDHRLLGRDYACELELVVMEKIRVFVKRPDRPTGYMTWMSNSLENLQRFVGGYIETVTVFSDLVIICNEEGRLKDLPYCCTILGMDFVGPIIVCGRDGDEFADVPLDIEPLRAYLGVQ